MNIVYIANTVIPSYQAHTVNMMNMCAAFAGLGHPTTLITSNRRLPGLPAATDAWSFYGLEKNFSITRIPVFRMQRIPSLFSARALRSVPGRDALIVTRHLTVAARAVRRGHTAVYECYRPFRKKQKAALLRDLAQNERFRFVVISRALKSYWADALGSDVAPFIHVIPAATNPHRFTPTKQDTPSGSRQLRIGYIGSFCAGRGIDVISELARLDPENIYTLYGGSSTELDAWRRTVQDRKNIFFHGQIPNADVAHVLGAADILLMPYQPRVGIPGSSADTARWMSPLKMFEYMAAGKSIIASDLPVLREVLHHGRNALLVPPDSPRDWLAAVRRLAGDPDLRRQIAEKARQEAESTYSWDARARKILDLLP